MYVRRTRQRTEGMHADNPKQKQQDRTYDMGFAWGYICHDRKEPRLPLVARKQESVQNELALSAG